MRVSHNFLNTNLHLTALLSTTDVCNRHVPVGYVESRKGKILLQIYREEKISLGYDRKRKQCRLGEERERHFMPLVGFLTAGAWGDADGRKNIYFSE